MYWKDTPDCPSFPAVGAGVLAGAAPRVALGGKPESLPVLMVHRRKHRAMVGGKRNQKSLSVVVMETESGLGGDGRDRAQIMSQ